MADGYDRYENESGGGGSFVMGLLTGTVLGAGLGMLFAPRAGSELRHQVAEQAGNLANTASEGYRRATESAGTWAEKGREMYDKARDAVARGADEAQRYAKEATGGAAGAGTTTAGAGGFGTGEAMRGGSSEQIRGAGSTGGPIPQTPGTTGGTRRS